MLVKYLRSWAWTFCFKRRRCGSWTPNFHTVETELRNIYETGKRRKREFPEWIKFLFVGIVNDRLQSFHGTIAKFWGGGLKLILIDPDDPIVDRNCEYVILSKNQGGWSWKLNTSRINFIECKIVGIYF